MMRRAIIVCCVVGLVTGGVVVWRHGAEWLSLGAVTSAMPGPDDGRIAQTALEIVSTDPGAVLIVNETDDDADF